MNPTNIVGVLQRGLERNKRPPDGLLHCSSDLLGSLRHAQLRLAGAPTIEDELVSSIRLMTGTMWHQHFNDLFVREGLPVMGEVRLDRFLPDGWSGTADWLFWDFDKRAFRLGDLKTTRGEGMYYIERDGVKKEHRYQLSAYYHALAEAKVPLLRAPFVCYLPMNPDGDKRVEKVEPLLIEFEPVPKDELWELMESKWAACQEYTQALGLAYIKWKQDGDLGAFVTDELAPTTPREQKLFWDKKAEQYDVKLVPVWTTKFCPYPNELCDCSEQGTTKIGHYTMDTTDGIKYVPRKGFENVTPLLAPSFKEFEARAA